MATLQDLAAITAKQNVVADASSELSSIAPSVRRMVMDRARQKFNESLNLPVQREKAIGAYTAITKGQGDPDYERFMQNVTQLDATMGAGFQNERMRMNQGRVEDLNSRIASRDQTIAEQGQMASEDLSTRMQQLGDIMDKTNREYQLVKDQLAEQRAQANADRSYALDQKQFALTAADKMGGKTTTTVDEYGNVVTSSSGPSTEELFSQFSKGNYDISIQPPTQPKTLADRNNNPGNIRPGAAMHDQMATGTQSGFLVFPDAQTGFKALVNDVNAKLTGNSNAVISKLGRPARTLLEVISVYAPVEDANDPNSYAAAVSKQTGYSPNTPVDQIDPMILAAAMAKHEGFSGQIDITPKSKEVLSKEYAGMSPDRMAENRGLAYGQQRNEDFNQPGYVPNTDTAPVELTPTQKKLTPEQQGEINSLFAAGDNAKAYEKLQQYKNGGTEPLSAGDQFTQENQLRTSLYQQAKPFIDVRDAYSRIQSVANDTSAAGDLALIFNYMKMLDPGSTVREGEFANAQNSAGVPERVMAKYNSVVNGERLAEEQRKDFVKQSSNLYKSQLESYKPTIKKYEELAKSYGLDPKRVTDFVYSPDSFGANTAITWSPQDDAEMAALEAKAQQ